MEDQGRKLRQILVSKDSFKESYLVRRERKRISLFLTRYSKKAFKVREGGGRLLCSLVSNIIIHVRQCILCPAR